MPDDAVMVDVADLYPWERERYERRVAELMLWNTFTEQEAADRALREVRGSAARTDELRIDQWDLGALYYG